MKRYIVPLLLFLGCVALFSFNLDDLGLLKGDENYYFSSARYMIREGDWLTPRYHHHVRFEKPVLYYWVVALFFKLFGTSWAVARFTSVIFGASTVLLLYLFALRLLPQKTALWSSVILATSFSFFQYSRLAVIDMLFLFLITLSLFLFVRADKEKRPFFLTIASIPLGLSVLAKGPLGPIVVLLIILVYAIIAKRFRLLRSINTLFGIILFLAIVLPWPLLMYKTHGPEYINHIWKIETVDKAVGAILNLGEKENVLRFALEYLGYYVPVVLFSYAPWSLLLPFGFFKRLGANRREDGIFISAWFWAVFFFFTVAGFKHTHYMLLLSPPLAMIIANFLVAKKAERLPIFIAMITVVTYIALTGFIMPFLEDDALKDFSLVLTTQMKKQDEEIGIASREFNLKKLGIYFNNLASDPYRLTGDDLAQYGGVKKGEVAQFLDSEERVFCLITKKDFLSEVPEKSRGSYYILERSYVWKKFKVKEYIQSALKADWDSLKEEAYLITNKTN